MNVKNKIIILTFGITFLFFLKSDSVFANTPTVYTSNKSIDLISFANIENTGGDNLIISLAKNYSKCHDNCNGSTIPLSATATTGVNFGSNNSNSDYGVSTIVGSFFSITKHASRFIMTLICMTLLLTGWYLRFTTGVSPPRLLYIR